MAGNALIGVLGCFVALWVPATALAAFPGDNGKILFHDGQDIYTINPDWTGQTNLTLVDPASNGQGAWSPDGRKIAFTRDVIPSPEDPSSDIYVMNADGTGLTQLASGYPYSAYSDPTWSPDGSKIAFVDGYGTYVMNADGSNQTGIGGGEQPDWSPDGTKIAFSSFNHTEGVYGPIYTMNPDGSDVTPVTDPQNDGCFPSEFAGHYSPDWSPDGKKIAFVRHDYLDGCEEGEVYEIRTVEPGTPGSGRTLVEPPYYKDWPAWSPDGRQLVYRDYQWLSIRNVAPGGPSHPDSPTGNYNSPDWQPLRPPGYARPKGASPAKVALVPAYEPCTSANASHGPPLETGSCSPPVPASVYLTVGSPDANGAAPESTGYVQFETRCNPPAPALYPPCSDPGEQIDAALTASVSDVRNKIVLTDYTGELRVSVTARITDRFNGAGNVHPGTALDTPIGFNMNCLATADETIGSTCSAQTSADALMPGIALEGKRAVWQLGPVEVYDGGSDGDADTTGDNTLFAEQGLFVP